MQKLPKVVPSVQALFGKMAEDVAEDHPVVLRKRKFTVTTLVRTFLFGFLSRPRASDEELAQTAALFGVKVTPRPSSNASPPGWSPTSRPCSDAPPGATSPANRP